jgi:uncharacterized protein (DUF362 family)
MHAVYVRGAILRLGGRWLKLRAFLHQFNGAVGGWTSSVRQHVTWAEAPLSRLLANVFTGAGILTGQIPPEVREHLRYKPFREFCRFNVEAEQTAFLCWDRLTELARQVEGLAEGLPDDFARIVADEERHGRIFQLLVDALDDKDALRPEVTAEELVAKVGKVGDCFLPRERRGDTAGQPLGRGGTVHVVQGPPAADPRPPFRQLLADAGLAEMLARKAAALGKAVAELRVAVKPTFMLGYHRRDLTPLTDPALLAELGRYLREAGCRDVAVIENRTIYDRFYARRTVAEVARYFGLESPDYRIVDVATEQVLHTYDRGLGQYTVGRTWKEADFRITFGKLRSHPVDGVHLGLANLEGLGARCDEFLFLERLAHRPTAVMMALDAFPPDFALLDGYRNIADGLAGVMGSVRPRAPGRLYAGADALAVDRVAARHLGLTDPDQSAVLHTAGHWFGNPDGRTQVLGPDTPIPGWKGPRSNDWYALLSLMAYPVYELASGRGTLFVPEMDEAAFPPLRPEGPALRLARNLINVLLGLKFRLPAGGAA